MLRVDMQSGAHDWHFCRPHFGGASFKPRQSTHSTHSTQSLPDRCTLLTFCKIPQRLLVVGAPLCLSWYLSQPAHCFTTSVIPIQPTQSAQPERHVLLRAVDSVADELAMMARAVYLLLLFMPAAVTAPLCMMLEWRRRDWLHLMRWTLERAGALILAATLTSKPHQPTMCDRAANEPLLV